MKMLRVLFIIALLAFAGNGFSADELHVADLKIAPGETKTILVELNNPDDTYIMLDFWMQLPEGISIGKDEEGELLVVQNSERFTKTHILEVAEQGNNCYKVLIYSSRNAAIKGNSGELFSMTVTASPGSTNGNYQGRIYSQVFSNEDRQEYNPSDLTFNITIDKPELKGDINEDGQVTIADVTSLVNIILGK